MKPLFKYFMVLVTAMMLLGTTMNTAKAQGTSPDVFVQDGQYFIVPPIAGAVLSAIESIGESLIGASDSGTCSCGVCCLCCACTYIGQSYVDTAILHSRLEGYLEDASEQMEEAHAEAIDDLVQRILEEIQIAELNQMDWFDFWWYHDYKPSLQDQTAQLNVAMVDQTRNIGSFIDAEQQTRNQREHQESEVKAARSYHPSEQVCVAGTASGGFGRAEAFVKGIRVAWENEQTARMVNSTGFGATQSAIDDLRNRYEIYEANFCDPAENFGQAPCGSAGPRPYADITPGKTLLAPLTIDARVPEDKLALEQLITNLTAPFGVDLIRESALQNSTSLQSAFLDRRRRIARQGAARGLAEFIASWRMPGSEMETWVREIREKAGVPGSNVSDNPSYKEVMHAMTAERFWSGEYAIGLIDSPENVERERLVLSVFYLMQLRDYFELLERISLVLAAEVADKLDERTPRRLNASATQTR